MQFPNLQLHANIPGYDYDRRYHRYFRRIPNQTATVKQREAQTLRSLRLLNDHIESIIPQNVDRPHRVSPSKSQPFDELCILREKHELSEAASPILVDFSGHEKMGWYGKLKVSPRQDKIGHGIIYCNPLEDFSTRGLFYFTWRSSMTPPLECSLDRFNCPRYCRPTRTFRILPSVTHYGFKYSHPYIVSAHGPSEVAKQRQNEVKVLKILPTTDTHRYEAFGSSSNGINIPEYQPDRLWDIDFDVRMDRQGEGEIICEEFPNHCITTQQDIIGAAIRDSDHLSVFATENGMWLFRPNDKLYPLMLTEKDRLKANLFNATKIRSAALSSLDTTSLIIGHTHGQICSYDMNDSTNVVRRASVNLKNDQSAARNIWDSKIEANVIFLETFHNELMMHDWRQPDKYASTLIDPAVFLYAGANEENNSKNSGNIKLPSYDLTYIVNPDNELDIYSAFLEGDYFLSWDRRKLTRPIGAWAIHKDPQMKKIVERTGPDHEKRMISSLFLSPFEDPMSGSITKRPHIAVTSLLL